MTADELTTRLLKEAMLVPGGYIYQGLVSYQVCFPLRDGGELRLIVVEPEEDGDDTTLHIDHYDGLLPPGITGPVSKTGAS